MGSAWDDAKISEAIGCRTRTVENVRQAFVLEGFEGAGSEETSDTADAEIARRCGEGEIDRPAQRASCPPGLGHWTLRLLADEMVALEVVESISHETVRQTLKKMG